MNVLKIALKIILVLLGGLMLIGGGICAVVDLALVGKDIVWGQLFLIAASVAGTGLLLIRLATRGKAETHAPNEATDLEAGVNRIENDT